MKTFLYRASLAAVLCTSLFLSCTTDVEPPPPLPPENPISSSAQVWSYCVYQETRQCYPGSYSSCPAGGELSDFCPFPTQSSSSHSEAAESSSSNGNAGGLSSAQDEQSSSSVALEYGYCVFAADGVCLPGPVSACPPGGTLSNACPPPTSSSGNVVNPSSSSATVPSSSGGSIIVGSSSSQISGQVDGSVFTDPRDGKKYKFEIAPNGKIWMSENLNYSKNNTLGYCYGVDIGGANPHRDSTSCDNGYGRIYEYATAMDGNSPQGLCPNGWHVPSTAEWNPIVGIGAKKMSNDFYIYSGNYNLNTKYPPVGWKERDSSGFYWTSSGNSYFTGFWEGTHCKNGSSCIVEAGTDASASDKWSVRCIANDDFDYKLNCGNTTYNPSTQFCSVSTVYTLCGGSPYNPSTQFCSGGTVYSLCGGNTYEPSTQICSGSTIYARCGSSPYNPSTQFCSSGTVYSLCGGNTYDPVLKGCCSGNTYNLASERCVSGVVMGKQQYYQITCVGGEINNTNCNKTSLAVENGECINLEIIWTGNPRNPKMECNGAFTGGTMGATPSSSISIKVDSNPAVTANGSWSVQNSVTLPKIQVGTTEVVVCVSFASNITLPETVKCELQGWW